MRALLMALILFAIIAGLLFGWRKISKTDVKVSGKLIVAAILSLLFSGSIYLLETS